MTHARLLSLVMATVLSCLALFPAGAAEMADRPFVRLRTLDKVTARASTTVIPVGQTVGFGSLSITVRACRQSAPVEPPESAAFLEIMETGPGGQPAGLEVAEIVFSGWMFASSPALSSLEHAVYDVWVLGCQSDSSNAAPAPSAKPVDTPDTAPAPSGEVLD
ncbi:MAG: DUF2155 domain-containing protein [Pseudomonadota bacterium]|nr:DUF2155 domain-containing protein [Pseudomonadota bacterium]